MKKLLTILAICVATFALGATVSASDHQEGVCQPQSAHIKPDTETQTVTITAPEGKLIVGYCVKAGSIKQGNGPEHERVHPPAATVTFGHSSGKNISHYTVTYVDAPEPEEPTGPTTTVPGGTITPPSTEKNPLTASTTPRCPDEDDFTVRVTNPSNESVTFRAATNTAQFFGPFTLEAGGTTTFQAYHGGVVSVAIHVEGVASVQVSVPPARDDCGTEAPSAPTSPTRSPEDGLLACPQGQYPSVDNKSCVEQDPCSEDGVTTVWTVQRCAEEPVVEVPPPPLPAAPQAPAPQVVPATLPTTGVGGVLVVAGLALVLLGIVTLASARRGY